MPCPLSTQEIESTTASHVTVLNEGDPCVFLPTLRRAPDQDSDFARPLAAFSSDAWSMTFTRCSSGDASYSCATGPIRSTIIDAPLNGMRQVRYAAYHLVQRP